MNTDRAKVALPPAPLMGHNRKFDRLQTFDRPFGTMVGVKFPGKRQCGYGVHLVFIEIIGGRILDTVTSVHLLAKPVGRNRIVIIVKQGKQNELPLIAAGGVAKKGNLAANAAVKISSVTQKYLNDSPG